MPALLRRPDTGNGLGAGGEARHRARGGAVVRSHACGTCALLSSPAAAAAWRGRPELQRPRPNQTGAEVALEAATMEEEMPTVGGGGTAWAGSVEVPSVAEMDPVRPWWLDRDLPPAMEGLPDPPGTREVPDDGQGGLVSRCEERKIAIDAEEVRRLRDRCRIDLGPHADNGGRDLSYAVPPGYEPSTSKGEMFADFLAAYMGAKTTSWETLAGNIKANYQPRVAGCFWDDGGGFMYRAVLHALALLASAPRIDQLGSTNEELYAGLRRAVRNGDLPLYLSEWGDDGRSVILVDELGRVAIGRTALASWSAITIAEISLSPESRGHAAAADYYFWWAWRLHSRWRESGDTGARVAGTTCARLALAAVADIAAVIAHEWVHRQGYWPGHCRGLPPASATDLTSLAAGLAAGKAVVDAFTWLGGLAVLGAFVEEGYHCRHNVIEVGTLAHLMGSFGLPFPPQWEWAVGEEFEMELLGDLVDLPVDEQQYELVWVMVAFVNFGATILSGPMTLGPKGNHDWYDTFWGFSSVLEADGCASVRFWITTDWKVAGSNPVGYSWQVPSACRDGGAGSTHTASFG